MGSYLLFGIFLVLLLMLHKTLEYFIEFCAVHDCDPTLRSGLWAMELAVKMIEFPLGLFALVMWLMFLLVLTFLQGFSLVLKNMVVHPLGLLILMVLAYSYFA